MRPTSGPLLGDGTAKPVVASSMAAVATAASIDEAVVASKTTEEIVPATVSVREAGVRVEPAVRLVELLRGNVMVEVEGEVVVEVEVVVAMVVLVIAVVMVVVVVVLVKGVGDGVNGFCVGAGVGDSVIVGRQERAWQVHIPLPGQLMQLPVSPTRCTAQSSPEFVNTGNAP